LQTGRQKILHQMIASIPWLRSALNFFLNRILICSGFFQMFELFLPFKLLSVFILWLRPVFWSRHMTTYFVSSAFTSNLITLLATTKASVFFFLVCVFLPNILRSAQTRNWCVPFNFKPFWFTWTLLMVYSKKQSWKAVAIKHFLVANHS
jgi:hypothetical protein